MCSFAWPDLEHRRHLYISDPFYHRIPEAEREHYFWETVQRAERAAEEALAVSSNIYEHYKFRGIEILSLEKDQVISGVRYFSEYSSGRHQVTLYRGSIRKWAEAQSISSSEAEILFLAHEYYHALECRELGLSSRLLQLPLIDFFGIKLGKVGIRALCEVGAETFSDFWYHAQGASHVETL